MLLSQGRWNRLQALQQISPQTEADFWFGRAISILPEKEGYFVVKQGQVLGQLRPHLKELEVQINVSLGKCGFKFVCVCVTVCLPSQCGSKVSMLKSPASAQHKCLLSTREGLLSGHDHCSC